jgi:hypothetical protein
MKISVPDLDSFNTLHFVYPDLDWLILIFGALTYVKT